MKSAGLMVGRAKELTSGHRPVQGAWLATAFGATSAPTSFAWRMAGLARSRRPRFPRLLSDRRLAVVDFLPVSRRGRGNA